MSAKKHGLGRGLDALLPAEASPADTMSVPVGKIRRNPRQPRATIDPGELEELAASIREHGVIQPLIVSRGTAPDEYILIAGERRLEASKLAGLERVPVLVRDASDQQRLELALIENLQREDLSPLETAEAYRHLHEDFGLSHEEVAKQVGKSRVAVSNTLRLLKLPERVRQALGAGQISEGHARAILALPTIQAQLAAVDTVLKRDLSVRQTEELARRMTGKRAPKAAPPRLPPDLRALEKKFEESLGTRVTIKRGKRGGLVLLYYYSDEELDAIAGQILKGK
ncbi:MAG: ParB/RepB/Spo0J family partition protein [Anaerolineales bacterium]|nr:ParB/RepB/Spo0J family partition protein [Anaerolineales bacterium]